MSTIAFNDASPQWQTYVDLGQDAKPYIQFPPDRTDMDPRLALLLDAACEWVQNYLGRPIAPTQFTRRFDGGQGWQGSYIQLPYYPVLEVVSVTEWWGGSGAHSVVEQTPSNQQLQSSSYQVEATRGTLTRTFPGLIQRPWFPGKRNVEVTWVAGYNPIPADVKFATLELFAHLYRNTQEAPRTFRPGGQDYDQQEAGGRLWPAVPQRVVMMLQPYVQIGLA